MATMRPIENLRRCNTLEFSGFDQSSRRSGRRSLRLRLWSLAKTGAFTSGKLICRKNRKFPFPANLLTKFQAQFRESHCKAKGDYMWLDLAVASGLSLPALIYGSLLFVHYMQ